MGSERTKWTKYKAVVTIGKIGTGNPGKRIKPRLFTITFDPLLKEARNQFQASSPVYRNTGKSSIFKGNRYVKTNVKTRSSANGFRSDQARPNTDRR